MESSKQPTFGLLNEILHSRRNAKPFELAGDQLVARHYWFHLFGPVLLRQRAASRFDGLVPARKHGRLFIVII